MRMPPSFRKFAPALNWIVLAALVGASVGALNALRIASENSYFQESMRGLAGRVLETGALRGACLGLLTAAGGFVLFALAWPVSRLILRSSRMATVGAWTAVPIIALLAVAAYRLNLDVFPSLLSAASLLGNAVLVLVALLAWWLLVKWLARRQDSLRALAGNGVVMTTMAGLLVLLVGLPMGLASTWKVEVDARQPNVWRILPVEPGEHAMTIRIGDREVTRTVWAGDRRPETLVPSIYRTLDIRSLGSPGEAAIDAAAGITEISVAYEPREALVGGLTPASWAMFISSLVFGFALRRPLGVVF